MQKPEVTDGREIVQKKYCMCKKVQAEIRFQELLMEVRSKEKLMFHVIGESLK